MDTEGRTSIELPACLSAEIKAGGNRARQLIAPAGTAELIEGSEPLALRLADGGRVRIVKPSTSAPKRGRALRAPSAAVASDPSKLVAADLRWIGALAATTPEAVRGSLVDAFEFLAADPEHGREGLRVPQLGAVHAALGYWTTGVVQPATIVMPTGTGKTETMVALFAAIRPERLLVIVPSDALRGQIASTFESLGVLQRTGVIAAAALRPVVGQVRSRFSSAEAARDFAERCNVIVATPNALFAMSPQVRDAFLRSFSHLFVDEAHHVPARTWHQIRDEFAGRPVLQFTATPFREDGRPLGGRMIYTFPLREAQRLGYFSPIDYVSVVEFDDPDGSIATRAIEQLRYDLDAGYDHLLMARVSRIGRAANVCELYANLAPDLNPVVLHSTLSVREQQAALDAVRSRASKVIVCIDMLGEGFDLPALKVAAIHDPHKSLGVTMQFVGRFARVAGSGIGGATVVVGRPDRDYDDNLLELYAEDADWNLIIRDLSEAAIGEQEDVGEFEEAFTQLPEEVSLRNLAPKMSTVVYRTPCREWNPNAVYELYPEDALLTLPIAVNQENRILWFVAMSRTPVRWGDLRTVEEVFYDLYIAYWDERAGLLYINSSNTDSLHERLPKALCSDDVMRITGENVYRVMASVKRLVPTNVGVLDVRSRRFSLHVGADVLEGFPVAEAQTKTKTNIFAYGYEAGVRVSVGASLKGRIWSYRVAHSLKHWTDWCDHVGQKLIDDGIDIDEVMRGFIRPQPVERRPPYVALGIEWPWEVFLSTTEETWLEHAGKGWPLVDVDLTVTEFSDTGPIPFSVSTPEWEVGYEAVIGDGKVNIRALDTDAEVLVRDSRTPLSTWFESFGPTIVMEQDAIITPPGVLLKPDRDAASFDVARLEDIEWSGITITKESQGAGRDPTTVQARVIQHVLGVRNWDLVIDDDGSGEIADVIAMRVSSGTLFVQLVHCKASKELSAGNRAEDLYAVCGQAQKSVRWKRNVLLFFRHLIRREQSRTARYDKSGFEEGDGNRLYRLEENARLLRADFAISIAQPGLSKAKVSRSQLELLGSTELYLHETANARFGVICSP